MSLFFTEKFDMKKLNIEDITELDRIIAYIPLEAIPII